jgi:hypothetical protein
MEVWEEKEKEGGKPSEYLCLLCLCLKSHAPELVLGGSETISGQRTSQLAREREKSKRHLLWEREPPALLLVLSR